MYPQSVASLISKNVGSTLTNYKTWGGILYNVKDYGAKGDGVADDTAAIQAAFNAGGEIAIPPGTYKFGPITIPSTVKSIKGYGNVKFIPNSAVTSIVAASWITALSLSDAEISGFTFEADSTTYPLLRCLDLTTCNNVLVERVRAIKGGGMAIYGANCNYVTVRKCKVDAFASRGINFEGASQSNITIEDNVVVGTGIAHCIAAQLGTFLKVSRNYCSGATTFGIGLYQVNNSIISNNITFNTGKEGINIEDGSYNTIVDNICSWTAGSGIDFGISLFGSAVDTQFNSVKNNKVINAYKSGIALAERVSYNIVEGNEVFDANQGAVANHAGILLYGTNCLRNKVSGNVVVDILSHYNYGISEYNLGTGAPTDNEITGNFIQGYVTGDINRTNTTTALALNNKDLEGFRTYTPVVAAKVGAITTASASGYYMQLGKIVFFYVRATITTNGTGADALMISLPFTPVRGSGNGKELAISGKALTVEIGASINVQVRAFDNTYPAANGSIVDISGIYQIA